MQLHVIVAIFSKHSNLGIGAKNPRSAHIYSALSSVRAHPSQCNRPLRQSQTDEACESSHLHQMAMYQSLFHNVDNDNELTKQALL